jgi:hypothetical protein
MNTTNFLDVEANFADRFNAIFDKPDYQTLTPYIARGFHSIKKIKHNSLLFIGLNPSFPKGSDEGTKDKHFYDLETATEDYKRFFNKFKDTSKKVDKIYEIGWSHLDMLVMRETKQDNVSELFKDSIGKQFISEQLEIAKEILELSKPKVIVVANSLARQFLGKEPDNNVPSLGYKFEFNETIGTDLITKMCLYFLQVCFQGNVL